MPSAEHSTAAAVALRNVAVRFGNVVAVDQVSMSIDAGQVVGLIGPNGAGKTTLLDAISGLVVSSGNILLHGEDVSLLKAAERSRLGLGRSFQDGKLFPGLTVRETLNVGLSRHLQKFGYLPVATGLARKQEKQAAGEVDELIASFGLQDYADVFIAELSTGTRRIVDLAAVVAHRPSILLLDEPSSGIAQRESEALIPLIRRIRQELDCTILIVEHDMPLISAVSDELVAMETGRVIARGNPETVVNDPIVIEAYLGSEISAIQRSGVVPGPAKAPSKSTSSAAKRKPAGSARAGPRSASEAGPRSQRKTAPRSRRADTQRRKPG